MAPTNRFAKYATPAAPETPEPAAPPNRFAKYAAPPAGPKPSPDQVDEYLRTVAQPLAIKTMGDLASGAYMAPKGKKWVRDPFSSDTKPNWQLVDETPARKPLIGAPAGEVKNHAGSELHDIAEGLSPFALLKHARMADIPGADMATNLLGHDAATTTGDEAVGAIADTVSGFSPAAQVVGGLSAAGDALDAAKGGRWSEAGMKFLESQAAAGGVALGVAPGMGVTPKSRGGALKLGDERLGGGPRTGLGGVPEGEAKATPRIATALARDPAEEADRIGKPVIEMQKTGPDEFSASPRPEDAQPKRTALDKAKRLAAGAFDTTAGAAGAAALGAQGANAADLNGDGKPDNLAVEAGGAVLGGVLGATGRRGAVGATRRVRSMFTSKAMRDAFDERVASREVRKILRSGGINTDAELAAAQPARFGDKPAAVADFSQEGVGAAARLAREPGKTGEGARARAADLHANRGDRLTRDMSKVTGIEPTAVEGDLDTMIQHAQASAKGPYEKLRAENQHLSSPKLAALRELDIMGPHLKEVNRYAQTMLTTEKRSVGDFEYWDLVKRSLDDTEQSLANAGKPIPFDLASAREHLVKTMDELVPGYRAARELGGVAPRLKQAYAEGRDVLTQNSTTEGILKRVSQVLGYELSAMQAGVISRMLSKAQGSRGPMAALTSADAKARLQAVFGPEKAAALNKHFASDAVIMENAARMNANVGSPTSQAELGGGTGRVVAEGVDVGRRGWSGLIERGISALHDMGYTRAQKDRIGEMLLDGVTPENRARIYRGKGGGKGAAPAGGGGGPQTGLGGPPAPSASPAPGTPRIATALARNPAEEVDRIGKPLPARLSGEAPQAAPAPEAETAAALNEAVQGLRTAGMDDATIAEQLGVGPQELDEAMDLASRAGASTGAGDRAWRAGLKQPPGGPKLESAPEIGGAMVGGLTGAATGADTNGDGEISDQERAIAAMVGTFIGAGAGHIGRRMTWDTNKLGTFGGAVGAKRLAEAGEARPQQAIEMAAKMIAEGADRNAIWKATAKHLEGTPFIGVHQGVDGKWRFEIDDSAARLLADPRREFNGALSDAMDDATSSGAYPDMELTDTQVDPARGGGVYLSPSASRGEEIVAGGADDPLSILMHEKQHAIQHREGFARGGSASAIARETEGRAKELYEAARAENPQLPAWDDPQMESHPELKAAKQKLRLRAMADYRKLAGEVEARNVQTRQAMSADERRASPPWETQDVPDAAQGVKFYDRAPGEQGEAAEMFGGGKKPPKGPVGPPTLDLPRSNRIFGPGAPDDLGFITTGENALNNLPRKFAEAKALTADQWRAALKAGGASNEGFTYQIDAALSRFPPGSKITRDQLEEAMARGRSSIGSLEEKKFGAGASASGNSDYSEYVAPGKSTNYQQELITGGPADYKSHNWSTPGTIGHIRTTDRVTTTGEKVRHVEELQSDLHQEGAKYGYQGSVDKQSIETTRAQARTDADSAWQRLLAWRDKPGGGKRSLPPNSAANDWTDEQINSITDPTGRELARTAREASKRFYELGKTLRAVGHQPPSAPLQDWEAPFVQRALLKAANDGHDLVTFPKGRTLHNAVQGDGTNAFYDERLPKTLDKVAKAIGGKVETARMAVIDKDRLPFLKRMVETDRTVMADAIDDLENPPLSAPRQEIEKTIEQAKERLAKHEPELAQAQEDLKRGYVEVPAIRLTPEAKQRLKQGIVMSGSPQPAKMRPPNKLLDAVGPPKAEAGPPSAKARAAAEAPLTGGMPEAMQRAREQGYDVDTPLYHGTTSNIENFDPNKPQRDRVVGDHAIYLSERPTIASQFAKGEGGNVMPVYVRGPLASVNEWNSALRAAEYDGNRAVEILRAKGFTGVRGKIRLNDSEVAVFDPKNIRSRFAKFDPKQSDSAKLLAGVGISAALASTGLGTSSREAR